MDSLTPRRGVDSHNTRRREREEGHLRGAVSLPVDEIGKDTLILLVVIFNHCILKYSGDIHYTAIGYEDCFVMCSRYGRCSYTDYLNIYFIFHKYLKYSMVGYAFLSTCQSYLDIDLKLFERS